jgi:hypothetical protein
VGGILPAGETETGAWAVTPNAVEIEPGVFSGTSAISFPIPLPDDLDQAHTHIVTAPTAECPGSAEIPEAEPGHLCVYPGLQSSANLVLKADEFAFGASRSGALISVTGPEGALKFGTFAVTAPE